MTLALMTGWNVRIGREPRRALRNRVASAVALGAALLLQASGCAVVQSVSGAETEVASPVWLDDGWIYYVRRADSDARYEIWRQKPDGAGQAKFAAPDTTGCAMTPMLFLFRGPHGRLGAGVCHSGDESSLVEYSVSGDSTMPLATTAHAVAAAWTSAGGGFLERITQSCWGISPAAGGPGDSFEAKVALPTGTFAIDSVQHDNCDANFAAKSPIMSAGGDLLWFLATADAHPPGQVNRNDSAISWHVCRLRTGDTVAQTVGPPIAGVSHLTLVPNGQQLVMGTHGQRDAVIMVDAQTGQTKELLSKIIETGISISPDGHSIAVANADGRIRIATVR